MGKHEEKLREMGFELPEAPARAGLYEQSKEDGNGLVWVSGCLPTVNGGVITGKAGDISLEEAQRAAVASVLNLLAVLKRDLGDLERIESVVKITVFVASADGFFDQPQVANAASKLLIGLFGARAGGHTRSAVGVYALPLGAAVEIEAVVRVNSGYRI